MIQIKSSKSYMEDRQNPPLGTLNRPKRRRIPKLVQQQKRAANHTNARGACKLKPWPLCLVFPVLSIPRLVLLPVPSPRVLFSAHFYTSSEWDKTLLYFVAAGRDAVC